MIHRLLIWMLALMLSPTVLPDGGQPEDPYQWLEDVTGERPLAWVKERNAESTGELTGSEQFQKLEHRILEILDSEDRIPAVQKLGPYYYNFWRDAKNPRGLWRRTTLEEYTQAQARLGDRARSRRPGQRRERKLGLARCSDLEARLQARPRLAFARRCRRKRGPGVRPDKEGVRHAMDTPCPRPRARLPGATAIACSSAPISDRAR